MESRAAIIAIIVENTDSVESLNGILHEYAQYLLGRMGIPYHKKKINIISVAIDAPQDTINTLSGKIGKLDGVSAQVVYSK
jgi:putative iron-only hydrogenase system regulator